MFLAFVHLVNDAVTAVLGALLPTIQARFDATPTTLAVIVATYTVAASSLLPLVIEHDGVELSLVSTIATIGAPLDITTAELAIEAFYPNDEATRTWLESRATV